MKKILLFTFLFFVVSALGYFATPKSGLGISSFL